MNFYLLRFAEHAIWRKESSQLYLNTRLYDYLKNGDVSQAKDLLKSQIDIGIDFLSIARKEGNLDEVGIKALSAGVEYTNRNHGLNNSKLPNASTTVTNREGAGKR